MIDICFIILANTCLNKDVYITDSIYEEIQARNTVNLLEQQLLQIIRNLEAIFKRKESIPNYYSVGDENIWMIKSKASSKGVGISLHKGFDTIVKQDNKLAQKYIENPLI